MNRTVQTVRTYRQTLENNKDWHTLLPHYFFLLFACLILYLCGTKGLPADTDPESAETSAHRAIEAIRTETPPTIDGILDDACWQNSAKTGELIQFEPQRGEPATQPTTIYLAYDANKLYVAFECFKTDMDNLAANQTRRDSFFFSDDHVEILIDTFLDGRNCYAFALNALGTQTDRRLINEGANRRSGQSNIGTAISWDCDWQGQAAKGTDRWTAEFAIPFAELRFSKKGETATWGINFWRNDEAPAEEQTWADIGERQYAVSRFGRLTDLPITDLVTKRPVKFKPYATLKPQVSQPSDNETTFEMKPDAGIDLRYPIKDFTIDLTLNPDFAQIEADPDLVNLSDIPLRFPEKRPFFLEGNELFQMPLDLFYSRQIEDLIGGGKVIGKFSKYNLAFVGAVAGPENPDKEIEAGELPLADYNYSVFRLQRELGKTSSVGFLGVNKQRGSKYDRAGGLDARVRLPADVNLNLEYAREWKAGGLDMAESTADNLIFVQLDRRTNVFSLDAVYADIGEHFNPETGFVPRVDRRGLVIRSRYNKQYKGILEGSVAKRNMSDSPTTQANSQTIGHVLADSSALKMSFSSLDRSGTITLTTTINPSPTEQCGSSRGGSHRNMCKSEIPAVSVSATTKTPFLSVQRLRSVPPRNSVSSLSYNGCMKKNKTRCNGNSRNGPDVSSSIINLRNGCMSEPVPNSR